MALAATNRLLRVTLDAAGLPTINPPGRAGRPQQHRPDRAKDPQRDPTDVADPHDHIGGKNPRGLVINSTDTRAYVMDFISRDVAVVDISGTDPNLYKTLARIQSAASRAPAQPPRSSSAASSSSTRAIGPAGASDNSRPPAGRMSDFGWGSCYSCHPQALTDSVTWMFADGPRQAISMESTFTFGEAVIVNGAPKLPESHQRALNWSAVRDEVQDFERNIRAVSGGGGLIRQPGVPEGAAGLGMIPDLTPVANTGRDPALDAIATYLALGVRAPVAPVSSRAVTPGPPALRGGGLPELPRREQLDASASSTTRLRPASTNRRRAARRVPLPRGHVRPDSVLRRRRQRDPGQQRANVQARGELGFNVPSLISVFASAPYLHSGAAPTLDAVLENVTHRSAGGRRR